jgi:gamma-glutamylcyclotransferase (GGCT)/AIG2-like uncharacterized protein YtfP
MPGTEVPLFLYGTLLDPVVLARVTGDAGLVRRLSPARLRGWRRVGLRGAPYPTLVAEAGAVVEGALLRVPPQVLARLAAYEGREYRLRPVIAETGRGAVRARAWIAPAWRADRARPWPAVAVRPLRAVSRAAARRLARGSGPLGDAAPSWRDTVRG